MISDYNINLSEQDYRDLELPSYSLLAAISKQGVEAVNGVSASFFQLKFGSLVDDMCFEPSKLVNYYHSKTQNPPTGNPKKIADAVLDSITASVGAQQASSGLLKVRAKKITDEISDYRTEILANAKALGLYKAYTEDKIMEVMVDKASQYFADELHSRGKIYIKPEMWAKAEVAADTLKTHDFTRIYFDGADGIEIFYQFKFIREINGVKVKGMLDCLLVDHQEKVIYPVDLKTGESPATMFNEVILLHKYYLQAGLYRQAIQSIVDEDPDLDGYTVANFEFVYLSKTNLYKPLIWVVPEELHQASFDGFTDRFGFEHKGLNELIQSYADCKNGMYCEYTKEVFENDGRIMLNNLIQSTKYEEQMED